MSNIIDTPSISRKLLIILGLSFFISCKKADQQILTSKATSDSSEKVLEQLIFAIDENGNPTEVAGYSENNELKTGSVLDFKTAPGHETASQHVFNFEKLEGYNAEFSEPSLVTGSYLAFAEFKDCALKTYRPEGPTVADILRYTAENNICGQVALNFCIRLTPQSQTGKTAYLKTPPMKMNLLCPEESFAGAALSVENGALTTIKPVVDLKINAGTSITQMYVTNDPSCKTGGTWEPVASEKKAWPLAQIAGKATVYIIFKNFMEQESSCLSASITRADTSSDNTSSGNNGTGNSGTGSNAPGTGNGAPDTTAPTAGIFSASASVGDTGFTLNWSAGSDPVTVTATPSLEYFVCSGASAAALDTVGECTAATQEMGWTANTLSFAVIGKMPSTTYYYNVVVKDAAGNQAIYPGISQATNADSAPTAGIFSASTSVGNTGFTLNWSAGSDTFTAAASLQYFVCSGASTTAIDSVAKCTAATQELTWTANATTLAIYGKAPSTSYYYNVVVRDGAGNQTLYEGKTQTTTADVTDPTAGSFSASTSIGDTGFTLNWSAGSDTGTATSSLEYFVCSGASIIAIDTAAECTAATQEMGWSANTLLRGITGKTPSTTYYYNVVVRDSAGNQSIYPGLSQTTAADSPPTAGTFSTSTSVGDTGFTLNWSAGSDTVTAAPSLEYFVCSGANAAAIDTVSKCTAATQEMGWTANTLTRAITGKTPSTTYYYNIVVRDSAGNQSIYPGLSQTTAADSPPTAGTFSTSTSVGDSGFTLNWSAGSDTVTATSSLEYFVCSGASTAAIDTASECTAATPAMGWTANTLTLAITGKVPGTTYYYNVVVRDGAGNQAIYGGVSQATAADTTPPTSTSISISSGATYTTSSTVTLGVAATDASEMYITNTSGCGTGGSWETYATTKAGWGLGQTNAIATVYVKYRDTALNETSCISDTIIHDGIAPTDPTSFNDGSASTRWASPSMSWSASTDGGSGVAGYEIAIGTTAGATDVRNWTSVGNVTSASVSGLTLTSGATYYGSVRAIDNAGNSSSAVNGDGFVANIPGWKQQAYVKASNNGANDQFGYSVALSSDTLAVGAYSEDSNQSTITNGTGASSNNTVVNSGAAYVYKRTGTSWEQEAYIKPFANYFPNSHFGESITLFSDTLAVGSMYSEGFVYIYKRTGSLWAQEAYLTASNQASMDYFSGSIALSSDTLAVGAFGEDSNQTTITNGTSASSDNTNTSSGAVYVYKRTGTSWAQEAYVKASNNGVVDYFGISVALSSDTLAVGAYGEGSNQTTITNGTSASSDTTNDSSGAVYVYKRTGTLWAQEAYVKTSNNDASDLFGISVALSSDTLAVGASGEDSNQTTITNGTSASSDNANASSGAVYVYKRTGTLWAQEAYVKASNNDASDAFGSTVVLSSDTLAVGAYGEASNQTTITNGTGASSDNTNYNSGAVYVYKRMGTSWAQEAYVKASNNTAEDHFGVRVALSSDTLAVGVYYEDSDQTTITNGTGASSNDTKADSGAVYIYTR